MKQKLYSTLKKINAFGGSRPRSKLICPSGIVLPHSLIISIRKVGRDALEVRQPRLHHRCFMKINLRGHGIACVEGECYRLGADDGILIFPYQPHYMPASDSDSEQEQLLMEFSLSHDDIQTLAPMRKMPFHLDDTSIGLLQKIMLGKMEHDGLTQESSIYALGEFLSLQLCRIRDRVPSFRPEPGNSLYHEIFRLVCNRWNEKISVKSLAAEMNMSESNLRFLFRQENNGIKLGRMIRYLRMNKAFELLSFTKHSIAEISSMCGFSDQFTFSRAFKAEYGKSPLVKRKESRMPLKKSLKNSKSNTELRN